MTKAVIAVSKAHAHGPRIVQAAAIVFARGEYGYEAPNHRNPTGWRGFCDLGPREAMESRHTHKGFVVCSTGKGE